ncbi:MAG: F0F1 ATP synthase subunit A [Opitutales bacterium]|jgi:F-type H+-transporting ATPase subunit a|nr:F0F1 ATP synthase subunit A [Opitutales bacterium]MDP4657793.1 F0F1 ATP synthase subunit A [Opitutales bacterium]MDP4774689.1 F0F1 ATP synthase subunit A [Opitutales bacterium]MDP4786778.1 F0F1 ATP synthase subunit A [Opitutales bacterium]MDP4860263.1 F0F1 ATP synthase subunit A [Opitutales bacterium]
MRPLFFLSLLAPAFVLASEEGVNPKATDLFEIGGIPVSNSILTTWILTALIIIAIRVLVGSPKIVPSKGQALVENMASGLRDALEPIVGKSMIGKVFPTLCGFFVFILLMNWSGLLPGVGTIKYGEPGHWLDAIRPATSDLNTTLALSAISFVAWTYFVLRYAGFKVLIFDLFGNKADKKELSFPMWIMLSFIFLGVGGIEVVSIAFRLISLSFRLYGNVYGGENLIHALGGIAPYVIPAVAGLLEVLVGLIQAFVFTLLSAVYIGLICNHEGGHDEEHAH